MAYYTPPYPASDFGEYSYNSYAVNYDYAQNPPFMAYNHYDFNQPYHGYDQSLYYHHPAPTYPVSSYPTISYSATVYSEPKCIEYDPSSEKSQLVIYYSNLEFNEPEFDEYDPTPYSGGYDPVQTYGKPLPPSDETCYPRSRPSDSNALPADGSIVPSHTVEERIDEKAITSQNGSAGQATDKMPSRDQPEEGEDEGEESEDSKEHDDDKYSGCGYGSGFGSGYNGGQYEEYEKQVTPQYPSGYGLEALDLCESLFGYWPCLSRMKNKGGYCYDEITDDNGGKYCKESMWKRTADYIFGSPYPYGGGRGESEGSSYGGELVCAYERHCPTQAQYMQIEHNENSW